MKRHVILVLCIVALFCFVGCKGHSLYKLPNGEFIRPDSIVAIRIGNEKPSIVEGGERIPWRVIIEYMHANQGYHIMVECKTEDECKKLAEKIGGLVGQKR